MIHNMKLNDAPFEMIQKGQKTIELRLNDEKRQLIKTGDRIIFSKATEAEKKLETLVKEIHSFDSFEELYKSLPLEKCGYLPEEIKDASYKDMEEYYSPERQAQFGVLGIEIVLLK